MKIAYLFPGQGAQSVGMGKRIYQQYSEARNIYEQASHILGKDMIKLCFESTEEELAKTENTQIAIAVTSLAMLAVLEKKNIQPQIVAGLSLGEYVALMSAGILTPEQGFTLLQKRGYCMAHYVPNEPFAMAAIIGIPSEKIEEVCKHIQAQEKFVTTANYNYSDQTVISGNEKAVEQAMEVLKEKGRVVKLKTGGAFHTSKLEQARQVFQTHLQNATFDAEKFENSPIKIIKNIDGTPYTVQDNIAQILSHHIVSPLRFDKTIEYMLAQGIDTFVEVGPGKTLIGFVKKELVKRGKDMTPYQFFDSTNFENIKEENHG